MIQKVGVVGAGDDGRGDRVMLYESGISDRFK